MRAPSSGSLILRGKKTPPAMARTPREDAEAWGTSHRVDEYVHVGGYLAAAHPAHVRARGITHILKLFADDPSYPGGQHRHPGVEYLVVAADDAPGYPLERHFVACLAFFQKAVRARGQILLHCHMGISRAPTIAMLYLIVLRGFALPQAWRLVKSRRPMANPNPGFLAILVDVDARVRRLRAEKKRGRPPGPGPAGGPGGPR
jgi:predicted protein tyrosine phosphatase